MEWIPKDSCSLNGSIPHTHKSLIPYLWDVPLFKDRRGKGPNYMLQKIYDMEEQYFYFLFPTFLI